MEPVNFPKTNPLDPLNTLNQQQTAAQQLAAQQTAAQQVAGQQAAQGAQVGAQSVDKAEISAEAAGATGAVKAVNSQAGSQSAEQMLFNQLLSDNMRAIMGLQQRDEPSQAAPSATDLPQEAAVAQLNSMSGSHQAQILKSLFG